MHLGNGIICPMTGIPMTLAALAGAVWAYKKAKKDFSKDKIFLSVASVALVFSLQMINFAIPSTSSSGHIIGALLLAIILGPYSAYLAMCAILIVQALFFADGSFMALGCNMFNMGILACFVAYPLVYKPLEDKNKPFLGALLGSFVALELASIATATEAFLSGTVAIFGVLHFAILMQAIHLPISIAEGIATGFAASCVKKFGQKKISFIFAFASLIFAGLISKYASQKPDGLEWSLLNISDKVTENTQGILYNLSTSIQAKTSVFLNLPYGEIAGLLTLCSVVYLFCVFIAKRSHRADVK